MTATGKPNLCRHWEGFYLVRQRTDLFAACYLVINFSTTFNGTLDIGGYTLYIIKLLPQSFGITKEHQDMTNKYQCFQFKYYSIILGIFGTY